jgi:hypothetical protein
MQDDKQIAVNLLTIIEKFHIFLAMDLLSSKEKY